MQTNEFHYSDSLVRETNVLAWTFRILHSRLDQHPHSLFLVKFFVPWHVHLQSVVYLAFCSVSGTAGANVPFLSNHYAQFTADIPKFSRYHARKAVWLDRINRHHEYRRRIIIPRGRWSSIRNGCACICHIFFYPTGILVGYAIDLEKNTGEYQWHKPRRVE